MTITVKVGEAKTHLSNLLAKVEAGEEDHHFAWQQSDRETEPNPQNQRPGRPDRRSPCPAGQGQARHDRGDCGLEA